jgi:hypothetical protein
MTTLIGWFYGLHGNFYGVFTTKEEATKHLKTMKAKKKLPLTDENFLQTFHAKVEVEDHKLYSIEYL